MSLKYLISMVCLGFLLLSCRQGNSIDKEGIANDVVFDDAFKGARLMDVKKTGENTFMARVRPENEPINRSPWYAFAVQAKDQKTIKLTLDYGEYQHRYVPKLSRDGANWEPMDSTEVEVDTLKHTATFSLDLSPKKLYVAAQEIETSNDTYAWMEQFVGEGFGTIQQVAGKTALGNNNYVMVHEQPQVNDFMVLVARQHPPEIPGGTIAFKHFYETLFSDTAMAVRFRERYNIYTFPLLNPDGVDLGNWRHNAKGVDLNRDWVDFTQPETQMVKDFVEEKVEQGKKIRFALDFHTSYSGPYLLVLDSINEVNTSGIIPEWINKIEASSSFKVEARRRSQELPYCYNYFFNAFDAEAVTYEEGDEMNRDTIRKRARVYAEQLMQTLLEKQKNGIKRD